MPRFFLEVSYKGTAYSGFQIQHNANTVQAEIEKAVGVLMKGASPEIDGHILTLTGSSRTDAGVHALQNFFHFDVPVSPGQWKGIKTNEQFIYKLNAILPSDIVVKGISQVQETAHCRFDAISREYKYYTYQHKDPFLEDRALYFPFNLNIPLMQEAATIIRHYTDFTSFSKRNTQVKTFQCNILESGWSIQNNCLVYTVVANRFLRGMVRGLTATMLKVGRGTLTLAEFKSIIELKDCTKASFAVPAKGLFLISVNY
jgi:tRNA pseudouridine38-40 synthase